MRLVKKKRDAIFIITDERACPIYNVGEELKIENFSLSVPSFKPCCLFLAQEISKIVSSRDSFGAFGHIGSNKARFDCGGCEGLIHFEFKKDRDFATIQMKMLNETEERRRRRHLAKFFGVLRKLDIFESLDDDALSDLTVLLELKTIPFAKVVVEKGESGNHLFIILSGRVAVVADDGSRIAELGSGEIFGEMSLISGEPVTRSIHTIDGTQVAMMSAKNFKHVLRKYPVLQLFLFKLLVGRAQTMTLRSGTITSGMTGELSEIPVVDLFQLINASRKTGTMDLSFEEGRAMVFFSEGEIVFARFLNLRHKDAVFAVMGAQNGRFTYTKGIPKAINKLPPIAGFMGMMMEGAQMLDEKQI